jgi:uncharacterized membrane protein YphA (DoxX/SURF4 family)
MTRHWQPLVQLVGRACLGLVFLSTAAARLRHFHERSGELALDGTPEAGLLLGCWIALAVLGGLAAALGWQTRAGLALLAICTLLAQWVDGKSEPVTGPLGLAPGAANLALLAAIVTLLAAGPGAWSFDASRSTPSTELGDSNVLG